MRSYYALRRFLRRQHGGAIIEFALVVPIFFMVVWAIITFSRAYQRLNTLSASLREGARFASTLPGSGLAAGQPNYNAVKAKIHNFSVAYGHTIDTAQVAISATVQDVTVQVTSYPLFTGLNFIGGLQSITVNRSAVFRLEGAP